MTKKSDAKLFELVLCVALLVPIRAINLPAPDTSPAQTNQFIVTEVLHIGRGTASSIQWSPDGTLLAVGGSDGIRLYTPELEEIMFLADGAIGVFELTWSPDGTRIACVNSSHLQIWDAQTGELLTVIYDDLQPFWAVAWSPDSQQIATSNSIGLNQIVIIWNAASGERVRTIDFEERIRGLAWSPDGRTIANASANGAVYVVNAISGTRQATLRAHEVARIVTWSPDGSRLASISSGEPELTLWDMATQDVLSVPVQSGYVTGVAWSTDGQLVGYTNYNTAFIQEAASGEIRLSLTDGEAAIDAMTWQHDRLATVDRNYVIRTWDTQTGLLLAKSEAYSSPFVRAEWNPSNDLLAVTNHESTDIRILDPLTGETVYMLQTPSSIPQVMGIADVAWSPAGELLASTLHFDDNVFNVWDLSNPGEVEVTAFSDPGRAPSVAWSPEGSRLVGVSGPDDDRHVLIWNTAGKRLGTIMEHTEHLWRAVWSPDGNLIATIAGHGIQFWDANTYEVVPLLPPDTDVLFSYNDLLTWSPDSKKLAVTSCQIPETGTDCTVWVWDMVNNETATFFDVEQGQLSDPRALSWSPTGDLVAVSDGVDTEVYLWATDTGSLFATLDGHVNPVTSISWRADGRMLAATDGVIHIWRIE